MENCQYALLTVRLTGRTNDEEGFSLVEMYTALRKAVAEMSCQDGFAIEVAIHEHSGSCDTVGCAGATQDCEECTA